MYVSPFSLFESPVFLPFLFRVGIGRLLSVVDFSRFFLASELDHFFQSQGFQIHMYRNHTQRNIFRQSQVAFIDVTGGTCVGRGACNARVTQSEDERGYSLQGSFGLRNAVYPSTLGPDDVDLVDMRSARCVTTAPR